MEYLLILISIALLSTIFYYRIDYKKKLSNHSLQTLIQKDFEELEKKRKLVEKEKQDLEETRIKILEQKDSYEKELQNSLSEIDKVAEAYKANRLSEIKERLARIDAEEQALLMRAIEEKKELAQKDIEKIQCEVSEVIETLQDLKEKRDNTLNAIIEEEKSKTELDFFRIKLSTPDIEDITELRQVEKRIHNKDILRKLIYKTYVEGAMNEMFNRIGVEEVSGIYKITNMKNNKIYIGQSTNIKNRLKSHIQSSLGISTIANQLVHDKISEHGLENFTFHIVEKCPKDQLNQREKYWISYYESNIWGYNKTKGNQ